MELARSLIAGEERFEAARAILRREPPRLSSGELGEGTDRLVSATLGLDHSVLPVQGPPGTGKTFNGARMILAALRAGRRIGITAPSHSAIQNLLTEVESCAHQAGEAFAGVYKGGGYESAHGLVEMAKDNAGVNGGQ